MWYSAEISYQATPISLNLKVTFIYLLSLFNRLLCRLKVLSLIFIILISSCLIFSILLFSGFALLKLRCVLYAVKYSTHKYANVFILSSLYIKMFIDFRIFQDGSIDTFVYLKMKVISNFNRACWCHFNTHTLGKGVYPNYPSSSLNAISIFDGKSKW